MMDINDTLGKNAGIIWETLNKYGSLSETKLLKITNLKNGDLYGAIGWLARENKITKNKFNYSLGETNLTGKIGVNAGKIWEALTTSYEIDFNNLLNLLKIEEKDAYSAIGWLARENKIETIIDKNKTIQFKLK